MEARLFRNGRLPRKLMVFVLCVAIVWRRLLSLLSITSVHSWILLLDPGLGAYTEPGLDACDRSRRFNLGATDISVSLLSVTTVKYAHFDTFFQIKEDCAIL